MYVITVTFEIDPEHVDDFRAAMETQARTSLEEEDGCLQFDVCGDPDDPTVCFLYEIYTDREAFDVHLASAHFKSFDATVAPWVASKTVKAFERTWPSVQR